MREAWTQQLFTSWESKPTAFLQLAVSQWAVDQIIVAAMARRHNSTRDIQDVLIIKQKKTHLSISLLTGF